MAHLTTFVFTDLVGSVSLKAKMPGVDAAQRDAAYVQQVLQPHRQRIEAHLDEAGGRVVSTAGDGHFLVFPDTLRAAWWALQVLRDHQPATEAAGQAFDGLNIEVRLGMHAGTPQPDPADPDNFVGRAVDYAARLADHAQGGQILVSRTTASIIEDGALSDSRLHSHGEIDLKGIGKVETFELLGGDQQPTRPRKTPSQTGERSWSVLPRTMGLTEYIEHSGSRRPGSAGSSSAVATSVRPRRLGNYELGDLLGAGGMGNVYKARHAQFDRARAVKIIRPDLVESGGESVVRRFYQEVRANGSLEHPNLVVAIDSSSPGDETHYLVMEYIDGVSLDELLRNEGPLPIADACEIARQAALGLEHLYEEGLVHRDVKPSNLMLTLASSPHAPVDSAGSLTARSASTKLPVVKLMDLGLALLAPVDGEDRLTQMDRGGMGTGHYMPPEQWKTTSVDIRADIYSLGCTLYHLLTGEPPFAQSDLKPERSHATEPPPPLSGRCDAPPELARLVERMLAKRPEDRPQTPLDVVEALTPLAAGHGLAERVTRYRKSGGSSTRRSDHHLDTRPERDEPAETNVPSGRRLDGTATDPAGSGWGRWILPALVTLAACAALLAVMMRGDDRAMHADKLKSDAGFAAREMANAIDSRVHALETAADEPRLPEWIATVEAGEGPLENWLIQQRGRWDEKLHYRSASWFVTDARGVQIARAPHSPKSIGESYAHRDYFHGRGKDLEKGVTGVEPIREPHRSAVYDSSSAPGKLKVAFSTPIYGKRSEGRRPVVGVLAMSIELGDFAEFDEIEATTGTAEILLVDTGADGFEGAKRRGLVLQHRDLASHTSAAKPVRLSKELQGRIAAAPDANRGVLLGAYPDILGRSGSDYLGAYAPVKPKTLSADPRGPWVVIAQKQAP
ncbi:Serine/threonine-protein kinase PknB [Planctomycetes bacterium MalM25]|nr:Serine/threonine-protein kinase PknB [Planctomycetes bacterium MalM25]